MTKEEIYEQGAIKACEAIDACLAPTAKMLAFGAMSEYAEQESIAFAEWVKEWWVIKKGRYIHKGDFYNNDKKHYTTKELYTLYQESKTK